MRDVCNVTPIIVGKVMGYKPRLSALRGLGSQMVVANHAMGPALNMFGATVGVVASSYLAGEGHILGGLGVALFLSLSIFLLMGSLDSHPRQLRHYFYRRIKRIWPLYFGACVVTWLLIGSSLQILALNLTFAAVWFPGASYNVLWTLQIEEAAYVFFPLIAMLSPNHRVLTAAGMIVTGLLFSMFALLAPGASWVFSQAYFTPFPWMACYGVGLLAYQRPDLFTSYRWGLPALGLLGLWSFSLLSEIGLELVMILPLIGLVLVRPPSFLKWVGWVAIGEISYALYLTHYLSIQFLGLLGIPFAYGVAATLEVPMRYKEIRQRLFPKTEPAPGLS